MSQGSTGEDDGRIGRLLEQRYRIVRRLGEGGMGAVYEGRHERIGRRVAIKTLHPQLARDASLIERFHREARAATSIGNQHIIEVTDFGTFEDDGAPYIVMEFLEGIEFGELLDEEGSLPIARVVHIVGQVCEALAAAHGQGIVHRDIKPENIYLVERGGDPDFVKVLDFGISKIRSSEEELSGGLTKTGMAIGTPYYMPPEQAQAVRDLDHRADIYAVGVILYQSLCGRLPFDAETYPALIMKIMNEEAVAPSRLRDDIPRELEQVVLRAIAKDRNERFQSIDELGLSLVPFAALDRAPVMLRSLRPAGGEQTGPIRDEGQIAMIETALSTSPPPAERDATLPPADTDAAPSPSKAPPTPNTRTPMARSNAPVTSQPPDASVARLAVFAGVALALVSMGALAFVALGPRAAPAPAPEAPQPHLAAPAPAPAAPAPAAQEAEAAASKTEVRVRIEAQPAEARIFIDGVEFPNPTDAFRPRSLEPASLRIEAPGYRGVEQLVIFDQDRQVSLALEQGKRSGGAGRPQRAKRPEPAAAPAKVVDKRPAAAAPTKPTAKPPPTERPAAGDDVYRGPTGAIRDDF